MHAIPRLLRTFMLLVILLLSGCRDETTLQSALSDAEANEIVAVLQNDGIEAEKRVLKDGVTINIDNRDMARATAILNAKGLPRKRQARLGDVFKKDGLVSSPLEERARYIYALSQEIEYTLTQIDGVIVARVHVVLPEKVAPGEAVTPSSAAVFIKHAPSLDVDLLMPRVKQLISRSIPGLWQAGNDKVSVVFVPASDPGKKVTGESSAAAWTTILGVVLALLVLAGLGSIYLKRNGFPQLRPRGAAPETTEVAG